MVETLAQAGSTGILGAVMIVIVKVFVDFMRNDREESRASRREAREAYDRHIEGLTEAITKNTEVTHELAVYLRAQNGSRR